MMMLFDAELFFVTQQLNPLASQVAAAAAMGSIASSQVFGNALSNLQGATGQLVTNAQGQVSADVSWDELEPLFNQRSFLGVYSCRAGAWWANPGKALQSTSISSQRPEQWYYDLMNHLSRHRLQPHPPHAFTLLAQRKSINKMNISGTCFIFLPNATESFLMLNGALSSRVSATGVERASLFTLKCLLEHSMLNVTNETVWTRRAGSRCLQRWASDHCGCGLWRDALCFCSVSAADNPWHNQVTETVKALGYSLSLPALPHYSAALFTDWGPLKQALPWPPCCYQLTQKTPLCLQSSPLRWLYESRVGGPAKHRQQWKEQSRTSRFHLLSVLVTQCRSLIQGKHANFSVENLSCFVFWS